MAKKERKQEEMLTEAPAVHCLGKMVPIGELKPNPENPNVHPDEQLEVLADVLRVNGWRQPIVVSNLSGLIVKGHGRYQTAAFMKLKEVPVDYQDYADAQAEFQDMVADNRVAQLAYVDAFKLGGILRKMSAEGQKHLGYSQEEIQLFSSAEYVATEKTDRKFVVLETLKLTKEAKAIIGGAVQKYCLRIGKEADWGEALAAICMAWQVVILPTMPQAAPAAKALEPAKPKPEPAKEKEPKPAKKEKPGMEPPKGQAAAPETQERTFRVKYVASTGLPDGMASVIRTDDSNMTRCYTRDEGHKKVAESAKASGRQARAVTELREGLRWVVDIEEVA